MEIPSIQFFQGEISIQCAGFTGRETVQYDNFPEGVWGQLSS
jgi:hypothetical protein